MIADNRQTYYAVLTGDLVKSAKLDPVNLKMVLQRLQEGQVRFNSTYAHSIVGRMAIFSGDSWQVLISKVNLSFRLTLYFRALVKASEGLSGDTRIAVAWGQIDEETLNPDNISESTGQAFTLSGRALADMDRFKHLELVIPENLDHCSHGSLKLLWPSILLLDEVSGRWTGKQSEILALALLGYNQNQIASELNIAQPTVSNSLNAAGWKRLKEYLDYVENSLIGL